VVIPAYNREDLLPRALGSVAAQTSPPAETIVVDDGSTDATADVARSWGARVIAHQRNRGLAAARNTGVEAAANPWVAFLDSDDQWLPDHLRDLWAGVDGHVLVANSALRCGPSPAQDWIHGPFDDGVLELDEPSHLVFPGNVLPVSAAMARRDAVLAAGGFRPPSGVADLDLWIRLLEGGPAAISPAVRAIYHVHDEQMSQEARTMQEGHLEVAERYAGRGWWSPRLVEQWRAHAAWNDVRAALRRRDLGVAFRRAVWIAARPRRALAVLHHSQLSRRLRRRSGRVGRDGRPSVAALSGVVATDPRVGQRAGGRPVIDLSQGGGYLRGLITVIRRPPAELVARSRSGSLLARAVGARALIVNSDARS
jgi:glycosyltransferase involved in cell wall biosynthesis